MGWFPNLPKEDFGSSVEKRALKAEGISISRQAENRPPLELHHLSLTLGAGEFALLRGPSGAGKTSFMLALARLIPIREGGLSLNGREASAFDLPEWRLRVNLVSAHSTMVEGTVLENLLFPWQFRVMRDRPRPEPGEVGAAMAELGLDGINPATDGKRLSTGQLARVALLRALLVRPDFLLLDEPTANLDPETTELVWAAIGRHALEAGTGVFCVTHRPPALRPAAVLRLEQGRLQEEG